MADVYGDALRSLQETALTRPAVLAFYSGGKDSLAVLDLCCRAFRQVVAVHMWFVPGLAVMEERLEFARQRWGVPIHYVPHWIVSRYLRKGIYCLPQADVPRLTLAHVYALARAETGVDLIASGGKRSDGMWRRRRLRGADREGADLLYPIAAWNKWDVLAYLEHEGIKAPPKFDLDLSTKSLLWLHDEHPEDFRRVCQVYPHAEAVPCRRQWYGVGA